MEKFDFDLIDKSKVYVADINVITFIDSRVLSSLKSCGAMRGDFTAVCKSNLSKQNAILLRVDSKHLIDIDCIVSSDECERINKLIVNEKFEDNIFMTLGTEDPYIGQLFLTNIRAYHELKSEVTDITRLRLINKDVQ